MKIIANIFTALVLLGCTLHAAAEPKTTKVASFNDDYPANSLFASLVEARAKLTDPKRAVGRQTAANIAKRVIERRTGQSARVTDIGREDDHGARWEVEVTSASGREFDVYVNAAGRVVKIVRMGRDSTVSEPNRQEAGTIAVAHVRKITGKPARITWIGPEDDYGARWEVEVTRDDGFEYDVYVDASGKVIRVKEVGFDS
jgi:uncharacterized membrane protein YkoI